MLESQSVYLFSVLLVGPKMFISDRPHVGSTHRKLRKGHRSIDSDGGLVNLCYRFNPNAGDAAFPFCTGQALHHACPLFRQDTAYIAHFLKIVHYCAVIARLQVAVITVSTDLNILRRWTPIYDSSCF